MNLVIRRLELEDEAAFAAAVAARDEASAFHWVRPTPGQTFGEWIDRRRAEEAGIDVQEGLVPATILCGFVDGELVAMASVRHRLNEALAQFGGHVGYGVLPAWRRRGIATRMLEASLAELLRRGVGRALVSCDESNAGSRRTIEKSGGVFESLVRPAGGGEAKRRYWFDLNLLPEDFGDSLDAS